jgi:hypothetical protein
MTFLKIAAAFAALVASCVPPLAADNLTGRWAADAAACEGGFFAQSPLVVTNYAVRWQGDTCRIGRMYKAGETTYIQAFCWGATGERSIPVSLHPHAGRLSVTWDRGARGELQRCP